MRISLGAACRDDVSLRIASEQSICMRRLAGKIIRKCNARDDQDGHCGVLCAQDADEFRLRFGQVVCGRRVRIVIQHQAGRVGDLRYHVCHLRFAFPAAGKAEVDDLPVEPPAQDIGIRHARARGAPTVGDGCAVGDNRTRISVWQLGPISARPPSTRLQPSSRRNRAGS